MHVENIKAVIERIKLAKPSQLRMNGWFVPMLVEEDDGNSCGTAACLAGWAMCVKLAKNPKETNNIVSRDSISVERLAQNFLLLDSDSACRLFYLREPEGMSPSNYIKKVMGIMSPLFEDDHEWVDPLSMFDDMPPLVRHEAAIHVLESLLETGKVDWLVAIRSAVSAELVRRGK